MAMTSSAWPLVSTSRLIAFGRSSARTMRQQAVANAPGALIDRNSRRTEEDEPPVGVVVEAPAAEASRGSGRVVVPSVDARRESANARSEVGEDEEGEEGGRAAADREQDRQQRRCSNRYYRANPRFFQKVGVIAREFPNRRERQDRGNDCGDRHDQRHESCGAAKLRQLVRSD